MHRLKSLALVAVALGVLVGAQGQDRPDLQMKAAVYKETVEGDLQGAIALYKQIASNASVPRPMAAAALLGLGGCYEKVGEAQARAAYERLIAGYPEQTREVAEARARLATLKAARQEGAPLPALRLAFHLTGATAGASAAVSPDGRFLAYIKWETGDLAVRDLRSGQSHAITNKGGNWETDDFAFGPRWSPDGKRLAYYWYRSEGEPNGLNELRITDLPGKNVKVLSSRPYSESTDRRGLIPVGWFPDGTAFLATSLWQPYVTEIVRVSEKDGAIASLGKPGSTAASRVCLSPDGRFIAFDQPAGPDSLNMDVFVMLASGGRALEVVTGPYDDRLLDWTPDGRRILFVSNRSGAYDAWLMRVDEGKAAGAPLLLRKELGLVTPIGFSPDGTFYFAPDVSTHDVMVADWNPELQKATSAAELATEHFTGATRLPAWSRDGRKLAYVVDRGFWRPAESRVRIRDIESGAERTLEGVNGSVSSLSWSPDGSALAVTVGGGHSLWRCQVVEANSGKIVREITGPWKGGGVYKFLWAPEGDVAFYAAGGGGRNVILRRDLRTGSETQIYTGSVGVPMDIAISPDGRHLAAGVGQRIVLIPGTGGEPRELTRLGPPGGLASDTIAWSPDGGHVYFGRRLKEIVRLQRIALSGGAPDDVNLEIGEELRFRPDGRRLAFTVNKGETGSEIWVMENVLPPLK